ncbi:5-oxoprolinase subunit PxpB [Emticicia sp. SJ17W-69]|uniref:5-oxoprolinase subunit PxpB n=1 Tax=Emticicia sp. SJ17W-69 TaxID=3421657 RepID=UPI003EBB0E8E
MALSYKIFSLSDSAVTIDFGNVIDEKVNNFVMRLYRFCRDNPFLGMIEVMPAYASLTVFYDVLKVRKTNIEVKTAFDFTKKYLENSLQNLNNEQVIEPNLVNIPVIYDGEDLNFVAEYNQLSIGEVIKIHTSPIYRVYMMGFLPGFAYMGGLDARIATPRKSTPRTKVAAGSVGIAGNQTGIYPSESPGGWQLIGRTELQLYTPNSTNLTLLKAGDLVKFFEI